VEADLVVGADAIRSTVRRYINVTPQPCHSGVFLMYGMMKKDRFDKKLGEKPRVHRPTMLVGQEGSFIMRPTDYQGEEVAWIMNHAAADRSRKECEYFVGNKNELRRLIMNDFYHAPWAEEVQILCWETLLEELKPWK
jgi:2-polyprenyl-6-methoxyphenol hydroxylase-like FAD-dependent oxidoreductase